MFAFAGVSRDDVIWHVRLAALTLTEMGRTMGRMILYWQSVHMAGEYFTVGHVNGAIMSVGLRAKRRMMNTGPASPAGLCK